LSQEWPAESTPLLIRAPWRQAGRTIAVQGCGLANIYPQENINLYKKILESGAVISELPLQFEPRSENFPARNRIIAGLSLGTIVIEAPFNSGALITAKAAIDYNREVMAVPGKIDSPLNRGAHQLIKEGAKLIESVADVTEALGYVGEQLTGYAIEAAKRAEEKMGLPLIDIKQFNLSKSEKAVYEYLHKEPLHIEQIISDTGLQAGEISSALISLQLKGVVKQLPGSYFVRR
jgi:DNA processing protein